VQRGKEFFAQFQRMDVSRLVVAQEGLLAATNEAQSSPDRQTIHELANMAAQRLRSQDEDDPGPHRRIQGTEQPSKKEAKEIEETQKFQNPKLASKKIVLKVTRNVLRCTNSRCKATFWNREVNAARNILELLSARLLSFERIPAFARSCPAVKATWAARDP
jgi:hypothetical protein